MSRRKGFVSSRFTDLVSGPSAVASRSTGLTPTAATPLDLADDPEDDGVLIYSRAIMCGTKGLASGTFFSAIQP